MILEISLAVVGLIASAVGFYVKMLYREISTLKGELQRHLVEDASKYLPRTEMNDITMRLRQDVQMMFTPLMEKLQSIEEYLRKEKL